MKVYILVDSEGQACTTRDPNPETVWGTFQAEYIRLRATEEASSSVEGARQAGAKDILVHDCGFIRGWTPGGITLFYDNLPHGIRIAIRVPVKDAVAEGFDAAFMIGAHARAGVPDGVMAHTFSSAAIECITLNGKVIGEIGIHALILGDFDIPVVMVSSDEAGCREAQEWLGNVEIAPVKKGFGPHSAVSMHPADACELLMKKARQALERLQDFRPFKMKGPFEIRVDCYTEEQAKIRAEKVQAELVGPRSYVTRCQFARDLRW